MMEPNGLSRDRIVAERDSFRQTLQQLIRNRQMFTETELAELMSVGVSFDPMTKQVQWTPVDGADRLVSEWNAYHHAALALMVVPECTWTRADLEEMETNGVTGEQLLAEIDEMIRDFHKQRNGQ